MYEGILEKFRQNRDIAYKLIETRNSLIAEATIDEYYWGIGKDKSGQNNIGKILVNVRSQIKKEILENIINKARECKKVFIIGHQRPDADSIFSSYLLSNILNKMGINASYAILENENYSRSDIKLIKNYLQNSPLILKKEDIKDDDRFILVDHNNLEHLSKEQVIGAIDHHVITKEVYDTIEIEYASTGLLIYDLFKNIYEFSEYEKLLIALTCLADTEYLASTRYKEEDKKLFAELGLKLDIEDIKRKYFVLNDFNLDIESNIMTNYKEYVIEGNLLKRYMIYSYKKEYDLYFSKYLEYIKKYKDEHSILLWCDFETPKTYYYYKSNLKELDYILTSVNIIYKMIRDEK